MGGAGGDDFHDVYVARQGGAVRWQSLVHWGARRHVPFREEVVWPAAGVAAFGGGAAVHVVGLSDGEPRGCVEVPDNFGHLALAPGEPGVRDETLYVLGWSDAYAVGPALDLRWRRRDLAVDGQVFGDGEGPVVRLGAERAPPGGWFEVTLDAATGRELLRRPDVADDYVGLYGGGRGA